LTLGLVLAIGVAVAATWFVVAPLLRRDAAEAERVGAVKSEERDLRSRHEMLLAGLKDLEDDRATGKLDDADYARMRGDLSAEAVAVMKQIDALDLARARQAPVALPE
jgi:hypothetical protein